MERGSYLLLEPGMPVRGRDGEELGRIAEVTADEASDIFRGFVLTTGGGLFGAGAHRLFVPGEHVVAVDGGEAAVDLSRDDLARLRPVTDAAASASS